MKISVFQISYYLRHEDDGPVIMQADVSVGAATQADAIALLIGSFDEPNKCNVYHVSNGEQDILVADPGSAPAEVPQAIKDEIKSLLQENAAVKQAASVVTTENAALEAENVALKTKITSIEADLEKLQAPATPVKPTT